MDKAELIILIILSIPLYGLLIWGYLEPEESILFGKKWMYKEDPQLTEEALRSSKRTSLISIILLTLILLYLIIKQFK